MLMPKLEILSDELLVLVVKVLFFLALNAKELDMVLVGACVVLLLQDEKLHDVLGHFQKDFEGGVSAENLGKGRGVVL